ncbi:hypothetical protein Q73_16510 [Bacillus coahuilensis m2-6]|uniref:hypothetical protein n=1 Tax=Bacillus coahuilensis TaxID=408580 RepID=UPI0001850FE3|nr:hypothetical protein [Bacillus coahuilensis]KUP03936.1 hypothetical protein Q73_16510 [Bacillus coahuilensis m2-6]
MQRGLIILQNHKLKTTMTKLVVLNDTDTGNRGDGSKDAIIIFFYQLFSFVEGIQQSEVFT